MSNTLPSTQAARRAIFDALARGPAPARPRDVPDLLNYHAGPYGRGRLGDRPEPSTLIEPFVKAARSWRAEVLQADLGNWPQVVRQALDQRGCNRVLVGQGSDLQPDLDTCLEGLAVRRFDQPLQTWKHELFAQLQAGITGSIAGVADTGSLLLWPGPDEPRTLSLIPPVHVAVLRASRLHASLAAATVMLQQRGPLPSNLLLVSGPSKTADIQQVLAYGAHGPKELVIVLVDDLGATTGSHL